VPIAPWRSALFILGFAAALIIIGAISLQLFFGSVSPFGPDTP
jgi:hypothetical protein